MTQHQMLCPTQNLLPFCLLFATLSTAQKCCAPAWPSITPPFMISTPASALGTPTGRGLGVVRKRVVQRFGQAGVVLCRRLAQNAALQTILVPAVPAS